MLPDPTDRPTLSVDEAAAILGVSRATAYRAVKTGDLPSLKFGRVVRVPTARLKALLGASPTGQAPTGDDDGGSGSVGQQGPPTHRRIKPTGRTA